jgi:hypothetical protein
MRDEVKDYPTDPNAQKSVSDWLMHVISGKPPIEGQPGDAAEATAPRDAGAVAVVEMPRENRRAKSAEEKKKETIVSEFTAEDLCGPAVFQMPAPATPSKEEVTADDLCFVPQSEAIKPNRNGTSAVAELMEQLRNGAPVVEARPPRNGVAESIQIHEPEQGRAAEVVEVNEPEQRAAEEEIEAEQPQQELSPKAIETKETEHHPVAEVVEQKTPEQSIASFITRERLPIRATQEMSFSRRGMSPADHEVTVADILRDRVLRQMQPAVEPIAPKVQPVSAETEATADVAKKEELPIERAGVVDSHPSLEQMPEKSAANEPSAVVAESNSLAEAIAEDLASAERHVIEVPPPAAGAVEKLSSPAKTESDAGAADVAKSVFAKEGIWGEAPRVDGVAREEEPSFSEEDPMYQASKSGFLKPEDLQALEHAMEEEKPENLTSALKTLVKLGSVLPWISRAVPTADGGPGSEMETGLSHEGRHEIANLRMIQYEIRSTVHDHSLQLKRMEELMLRVRESMDSDTRENKDLAEGVKSTAKLLRLVGIGLGILMVVLIVMVGLGLGHK